MADLNLRTLVNFAQTQEIFEAPFLNLQHDIFLIFTTGTYRHVFSYWILFQTSAVIHTCVETSQWNTQLKAIPSYQEKFWALRRWGKYLKLLKFLSKANISSGSREIHRILWNMKAYFRFHTNPPLVAISSKYSWKVNGFYHYTSQWILLFKLPPDVSTFSVR